MAPQIVLMTGCSAGIGLATAKRLALDLDQRYIVIATIIAMSEKTELLAAVGGALDKTIFVTELDVTNDGSISGVVRDVIKVHGRIDILINIAGLCLIEIPERVSRAQIDKLFNVNAIGPIRLAQTVLPHMKERRAGKIVTVSSEMGRQALRLHIVMAPQIVLITGCSAGIGLATAKRLALDLDQRYIVIATVIAMSEKVELVAAVGDALNRTVFIKVLDVTDDDNISQVVDDVIEIHGRIDILINNAGLIVVGIPELIPREKIDQIFSVNVIGAMRVTQAVLPHMKERRAGKILSMSSGLGRQGRPYLDFYCATKFAIEGFFESLAAGVRPFNIRVCLLEPGRCDTGMDDKVCDSINELVNDDGIDEMDRCHLAYLQRGFSKTASTDDIAEALQERCLDVDKPVLRHLLKDEFVQESMARELSDLTGELGVAGLLKRLGYSA